MNKPRLKLVFLIAFTVWTAFVMGFEGGEKTRAYLAFTKHDFNEALALYSRIGDESGCGMVFLAQNKPDEAKTHFESVNDESGMGLCALKKRQYTQAIGHFIAKNDQRGLGLSYLSLRDEAKAREAFSKANDWSGLGLLYLAKNQYKKAEECFAKVKDDTGMGLSALKQKKFNEAEKHFTDAKDDSGLGLLSLAKRDHEQAALYFQKANDLSGLGYVAMARGRFNEAEAYFTQANDKNGLGDLYSQLHQFERAREAFQSDNNPVKVTQSYRNDYTLLDKDQKALVYAQEALKEGKMTAEILMEMADVQYELKQPQKGLELLDQAALIQGYASEAHLRKGRIYFYLRDLAQAESEFQQVNPDDFVGEERYEEAQTSLQTIQRYKEILKNNPSFVQPAESF